MVSVEDRRFYDHIGVDPIGIAAFADGALRSGHWRQGASTITQQLARNIFLNNSRTFGRKAREAVLALALERKFSKDQILELYLNKVYFGGGAYGIDAASRKFFGHPATQLSTGEAAIIAGLVKAPSNYSPTADVDAAIAARQSGAGVMAETGVITPERGAGYRPLAMSRSSRNRARTRCAISPTGRCRSSTCCCPTTTSRSRCGPRSIPSMQQAATAGDRRQRAQGRARRAGQHGPRRRGAGDGRRHRLRHLQLQPRHQRGAPARLGVEAVRLSWPRWRRAIRPTTTWSTSR